MEELQEMYEKQITLGDLIKQLEKCKSDAKVRLPFGWLSPTKFNSYRGYYDQIALGYDKLPYDDSPTVKQLVEECKTALHQTYCGWKGGDFNYDTDTPVWLDNYGDGCGSCIIGVIDYDYTVILAIGYIN